MYALNQGLMAQGHPVGKPIIDNTDSDGRVIKTHEAYLSSYFVGYDARVPSPVNPSSPHTVYRYDYKILGTLYNVYTRSIPGGKEFVTSMWDRTSNEQIDDLEILVKRHNHLH